MIKTKDIMYAVYGVSDLTQSKAFIEDFGLVLVEADAERSHYRGVCGYPFIYGMEQSSQPGLQAVGLLVESSDDLVRAAKLEGASGIEPSSRPGGGQVVHLSLPGGLKLELVHGCRMVDPLPVRDALPLNEAYTKRRANTTQRPPRTPAQAVRVGHIALSVPEPEVARDWAVENLSMIVSDAIMVPGSPTEPIGFFMRFDLGDKPADHHSILIGKSHGPATVHHLSFEVVDVDDVFMGHEWMKAKGYKSHWGVGRHVLGSQIFDYWWSPDGFRYEHYTDGDQFDNTVATGVVEGTSDQLWAWGDAVPSTFFEETRYK